MHISISKFLQQSNWDLLGGELPGGSSDTLKRIYIKDPLVARDNSPDPRRHSKGAEKVDLICLKKRALLLVEAKPGYSMADQKKLLRIISERRQHLFEALGDRCGIVEGDIDRIVPALGFSAPSSRIPHPSFVHFLVGEDGSVVLKKGSSISHFAL